MKRTITIESITERWNTERVGMIVQANAEYQRELVRIAQHIRDHRANRPIILLSGPSGSGKTTTARILEHLLDESGVETHTLSMDHYFLPLTEEERKLADAGRLGLESPNRVDKELLNTQLKAMFRCEPVQLPHYDFKTASRVDSGIILERKRDELIILEGIHVFNPEVVRLPDDATVKIYVSVRTRVQHDGQILHPSKIRLLRRILRDYLGRGRTPADTIRNFESVQQGENLYISPYKTRSDFDVDTFFSYELGVYRSVFWDTLLQLPKSGKLEELRAVLEHMPLIPPEDVPPESLIREFIGNGAFSD